MAEDPFVQEAFTTVGRLLKEPLRVERGAALLYEVTVNASLEVTVDPRYPRRGISAFQTDLCVFDAVSADASIPRVVLECKGNLTTHDVLTYSAKARRHKQIYPYLRYGLLLSKNDRVPSRFYRHNEALDFCIAVGGLAGRSTGHAISRLIRSEIAASRALEEIAFERKSARLFRSEVMVTGLRRAT